jgi:hypothetical protein
MPNSFLRVPVIHIHPAISTAVVMYIASARLLCMKTAGRKAPQRFDWASECWLKP